MKSNYVKSIKSTRALFLCAVTVLAVALVATSAARAECTPEAIQQMRDTMSSEDIERICGHPDIPNSRDSGENVGAARGEFDDCRRRLDEVAGEHYDLMHQINERYLSGRDREIYDRERRTIWGSSDRVHDIRDCEQSIGQYESVNRQLKDLASRQQGGEEKYNDCITKLDVLRDEMASNNIQSPHGRPETLELCEQEYTYEKNIYRQDLIRQRQRQKK